MANVHDLAAYIINQRGAMTSMKLQKLCYYSQGWSLAWDGVPIFDEQIEAWANGPVVYELFKEHRGKFRVSAWPKGDPSALSHDEAETVDVVLASYGDFTGQQLSDMTHAAPAPANVGKPKWVDTTGVPKAQRKRVPAPTPIAIDDQPFRWSGADIDHEYAGEWDWNLAPKETRDLLDLLAGLHDLTWREVKTMTTGSKTRSRARHHDQPIDSICREAQQRLIDIGRGDQESVFRLRHGNTVRVWGVLEGPVFRILWYDRAHKICPTES